MIAGLFLRNYKTYKGAQFLRFFGDTPEKLCLLIGNNGTGKSSIMEALDSFFNGTEWILTKGERNQDTHIAPLFLIKKEGCKLKNQDLLEAVSNFLWDSDKSNLSRNYKIYEPFFELRDSLKEKYKSECFIITISLESQKRESLNLNPFNSTIRSHLTSNFENYKTRNLNLLLKEIFENYAYIHIPVETSLKDFLKLEKKEFQQLINNDLREAITKNIDEEKIISGMRQGKAKITIMQFLNETLKKTVDKIEEEMKELESGYDFTHERKAKANITPKHLVDDIVSAFFSKRKLRKNEKPIETLSSGERKKALVDIAYTFLRQSGRTEKEIILAIDEPESSLHISKNFDQFEKLSEIANIFNYQTLVATHWYGALPVLRQGIINYLEKNNDADPTQFKRFSFSRYYEESRDHPKDDLEMKSFFDLSASIVSSIRHQKTKWIIVESSEDRNYLENYLPLNTYKILPMGGRDKVKKLFKYLETPLSDRKEVGGDCGKILFIVDTDLGSNGETIKDDPEKDYRNISIKRLQWKGSRLQLVKINDNCLTPPTEIESALNSKQFYESFKECINEVGSTEEKDALQCFNFTEKEHSFIPGDDSILSFKGTIGKDLGMEKKKIIDFIENNKLLISEKYSSKEYFYIPRPNWIQQIEDFFENQNP